MSNKVIKVIISLSFLSGTEARCTARRLFNQSWSQERQVVKWSWCRSRPTAQQQQQQYCGSRQQHEQYYTTRQQRSSTLIALCWYKYRHCVTRWDSSLSLGSWTARTQTRPQERGLGSIVLFGGVLHTLCNLLFIDLLFNLVMWMDQFLT